MVNIIGLSVVQMFYSLSHAHHSVISLDNMTKWRLYGWSRVHIVSDRLSCCIFIKPINVKQMVHVNNAGIHCVVWVVLTTVQAVTSDLHWPLTSSYTQYTNIPNRQVLFPEGCVPRNTRRWNNVGLMMAQRRRRWANIKPTLAQRLMFSGIYPASTRRWPIVGLMLVQLDRRCPSSYHQRVNEQYTLSQCWYNVGPAS